MERVEESITEKSALPAAPKSAEQEACSKALCALLQDASLSEEQRLNNMERLTWEMIRMLQGSTLRRQRDWSTATA